MKKVILLMAILGYQAVGYAADIKLAWDPPDTGTPTSYKVYWGETSGGYASSLDAGLATVATVPGLQVGKTYYFAATALYPDGESGYSNEVFKLIAELLPPGGLRILEVIRHIDVGEQQ